MVFFLLPAVGSPLSVTETNGVKGIPLYVQKPAGDLLMRTVQVWKFDNGINVSRFSAMEHFSRAPVRDDSSGMLMSAEETNAVDGTNLTLIIEYPASPDRYDFSFDRDTGRVTDTATGETLFLVGGTGLSVTQKKAKFLDAAGNNSVHDTYAMYRVGMPDPYIQVNPVDSLNKGSLLNITGMTNLPIDTIFSGQLRVSNLYMRYSFPPSNIRVYPGSSGKNIWSWSTSTDNLPTTEYFLTVEPIDREIRTKAFSRVFSLLPPPGSDEIPPGIFYVESGGSNWLPCGNKSVCPVKTTIQLDQLTGHYNRFVARTSPDSVFVSNASFRKECEWTRSSPTKTESVPTRITRIDNRTIIIDPVENLCFTDLGERSFFFCNGCRFSLIVEYTYPNTKDVTPPKDNNVHIQIGYLWKDDAGSGPAAAVRDESSANLSVLTGSAPAPMQEIVMRTSRPGPAVDRTTPQPSKPTQTPKASLPVFLVGGSLAILGLISGRYRKL